MVWFVVVSRVRNDNCDYSRAYYITYYTRAPNESKFHIKSVHFFVEDFLGHRKIFAVSPPQTFNNILIEVFVFECATSFVKRSSLPTYFRNWIEQVQKNNKKIGPSRPPLSILKKKT